MNYSVFLRSKHMQAAADAYREKFGGRFVGEEPGGGLVYLLEDGESAYVPPENAAEEKILQDLQSGKTLSELWPELVYDPNLVY